MKQTKIDAVVMQRQLDARSGGPVQHDKKMYVTT